VPRHCAAEAACLRQQNRRPGPDRSEIIIPAATIDLGRRDNLTLKCATSRLISDIYRAIIATRQDSFNETDFSDVQLSDSTTTVQSARNMKRREPGRQALAAARKMAAAGESGAEPTSTEENDEHDDPDQQISTTRRTTQRRKRWTYAPTYARRPRRRTKTNNPRTTIAHLALGSPPP
jgi:hypothetical protein